jgi:glutamyl-tRNA synthetase
METFTRQFVIFGENNPCMMDKNIRVRFAPSPTGPLHIGGVRTALFNYLFARKHNGTFILRIEDTDQGRYVPGAEQYIIDSLKWCGIVIDEGVTAGGPYEPYRQSERKDIYLAYAEKLLQSGHAYEAYDSPDELEQMRKKFESEGKAFLYDASVRNNLKNSLALEKEEVRRLKDMAVPYVVRFRMPENTGVVFDDVVRERVAVNTSTLDDKVLLKADGMPTYHLANVVDDHLMKISHVIRGEEWLPSTPLHVLLYRAFGWDKEMPEFVHIPLTLKPDGKGKLSKRDGDRLGFPVFPLEWVNPETGERSSGYRESGYLPEAFINIMAFLGWNPGTDRELYTMEELVEAFSLQRLVKAGSRFDPEKARWFNHQYLIRKSDRELAAMILPKLQEEGLCHEIGYVSQVIGLIKERAFLLDDLWVQSEMFFRAPDRYDEQVKEKVWKKDSPALLLDIKNILQKASDFSAAHTESLIKTYAQEHNTSLGEILNPLRLLMAGTNAGPGLFDMMSVLGKQETLKRIDNGLAALT